MSEVDRMHTRTWEWTCSTMDELTKIAKEASAAVKVVPDLQSKLELRAIEKQAKEAKLAVAKLFSISQVSGLPARLDADGTAKPLTRIIHHPPEGGCVGPRMPLHSPEYENEDGTRTPLK